MAEKDTPRAAEHRPLDVQEQQRQAAREAATSKPARELDETVPGGKYMLDDGETVVDAHGQPLKSKD